MITPRNTDTRFFLMRTTGNQVMATKSFGKIGMRHAFVSTVDVTYSPASAALDAVRDAWRAGAKSLADCLPDITAYVARYGYTATLVHGDHQYPTRIVCQKTS
jgi:hypothetical protein